jgi:hypothetical protein
MFDEDRLAMQIAVLLLQTTVIVVEIYRYIFVDGLAAKVIVQSSFSDDVYRCPVGEGAGNATSLSPIRRLVARAMPRCPALFTAQ